MLGTVSGAVSGTENVPGTVLGTGTVPGTGFVPGTLPGTALGTETVPGTLFGTVLGIVAAAQRCLAAVTCLAAQSREVENQHLLAAEQSWWILQ